LPHETLYFQYDTLLGPVHYWDSNGFCLWAKQLQKGRFQWPLDEEDVLNITSKELAWLLSGLEVKQQIKHQSLQYKTLA
jgi:transposase